MIKSLTNKLHLKQKLYSHWMAEGTSIKSHLIVFKEIIFYFESTEVKFDNEDLGIILLCSLSMSYSTFWDIILYSCVTLTLDGVYDVLFLKEKIDKHLLGNSKNQGDVLLI